MTMRTASAQGAKLENVLLPHDVWTFVFCFLCPKAVLACAATCRSVGASATSANVWATLDLQRHWPYKTWYDNAQFTEKHKGCHPLAVFRAKLKYEKDEEEEDFYAEYNSDCILLGWGGKSHILESYPSFLRFWDGDGVRTFISTGNVIVAFLFIIFPLLLSFYFFPLITFFGTP